ncbi:hypothetical protein NLJ89_g2812 [Agrocybe chaxingu]|uniref:Uncharacterized protein n=1 Tax=Agrocybe chaxingu TaxID=84603 RepID=A0A9W8K644_9AGAR|nr:hypothetical protein NLJ89_g2812 [Agrocybe chaxingu]
MPSFAELKAKAANATSSGREKMQNMRDRNTRHVSYFLSLRLPDLTSPSVPMAKTNWDPYSGNPPPPPPPPRSLVNRNTKPQAPLPPPPSRTTSGATSSLSRASSTASTPPLPARAPVSPPPAPRSTGPPLPAGAPPPINRSTRPDAQPRPAAAARPLGPSKAQPEIDWANLSPDDKQVFFDWLDEFFSNFKPPTEG